ncbi:MAG: SHOCT domain-containing protein [Rhodopseudomonas sp.]|nr:SHOCT domain-containing protein [Rhodopseudomonas sp.]
MGGYGPGYGAGYGMMRGYGFGYGHGPVHLIFGVVILIALIVGIVYMVRSMTGPGRHHMGHMGPGRSAGLDVLEERYARGEINRDEYLQKKKDIAG